MYFDDRLLFAQADGTLLTATDVGAEGVYTVVSRRPVVDESVLAADRLSPTDGLSPAQRNLYLPTGYEPTPRRGPRVQSETR